MFNITIIFHETVTITFRFPETGPLIQLSSRLLGFKCWIQPRLITGEKSMGGKGGICNTLNYKEFKLRKIKYYYVSQNIPPVYTLNSCIYSEYILWIALQKGYSKNSYFTICQETLFSLKDIRLKSKFKEKNINSIQHS